MLHYYINLYSKQTIENTINTDLSKINAWTNYWLAKFNPNKNKVLFVLIIYPVMIRRYCFKMIFLNLLINLRTLELSVVILDYTCLFVFMSDKSCLFVFMLDYSCLFVVILDYTCLFVFMSDKSCLFVFMLE